MKTCSVCRVEKPLSDFHRNAANKKDGLARACKMCANAAVQAWRERYPERVAEQRRIARESGRAADWVRARRMSKRAWLLEQKDRPCERCGGRFHSHAMHFHHRPGEVKVAILSAMVHSNRSLTALQAEVAKCELLCANCHGAEHGEAPA